MHETWKAVAKALATKLAEQGLTWRAAPADVCRALDESLPGAAPATPELADALLAYLGAREMVRSARRKFHYMVKPIAVAGEVEGHALDVVGDVLAFLEQQAVEEAVYVLHRKIGLRLAAARTIGRAAATALHNGGVDAARSLLRHAIEAHAPGGSAEVAEAAEVETT